MEPRPNPDSHGIPGQDRVEAAGPPLSAVEAATVAGVNAPTIRRAIAAGHLPATKHRGAFRISPGDLAAWQAADEAEQAAGTRTDSGPDRTSSGQSGGSAVAGKVATVAELWRALENEGTATIAAKDETIGRLDAEVAYLRDQLDQQSRELAAERERFDVIQQLALQRIEALTAAVAEQRENAPTAAPGTPGAPEEGREEAASWLAGVWRKVIGGR